MYRTAKLLTSGMMLFLASTSTLGAQSQSRPVIETPLPISGPAILEATMTSYGAWIRWSPVANATGYKVTRATSAGTPETLISTRAAPEYAFEGNNCAVGNELPFCVFFDNQFRTTASRLTVTYRVYGVVPGAKGPITSPPSPSALLVWNCPKCPKLP